MRWSRIIRCVYKKKTLTSVDGDNDRLSIIDYISPVPFCSIRCLEDVSGGWYSAIYLAKIRKQQPFLRLTQKLIKIWASISFPKNILILGCAGCSIPRFLSHQFPDVNVVGVEKSNQLINIAKQYFFARQYKNFHLFHSDAFIWVNEFVIAKRVPLFNCIFVDLFNGAHIVEDALSSSFLESLYCIMEDDSLALFNIHKTAHFRTLMNSADSFQYRCAIVSNKRCVVALLKSSTTVIIQRFRKSISRWKITYEKYA